MYMIRISIAFGMSALVSLMSFAQTPASSAEAACPAEAVCTPYISGPNAGLSRTNRCEIVFTQETQASMSFAACYIPQMQEQRLMISELRQPQLLLDDPEGQPAQQTGTASPVDAALPDSASSTRIALTQNGPESGGERMPIAVYPIKFPYTAKEKFGLFVRDIYDPFNFMAEGFNALWAQAQGDPRAFGGGAAGYGKRLGAMVGTDIVGEFTGTFLFPSILHTDPRYFRMARGSLRRRFFYAVTRQLITKSDSGDDTWNASRLLSGLATTAVSNSYYPHRDRSFPGIVEHTLTNMGFDALNDAFREFWPDIAHGMHFPAFVIRRTADPTFIDPMDPLPAPATQPATQPSTQPTAQIPDSNKTQRP